MRQETKNRQPIVEIEVPCGRRHKHKALIYVESWNGQWLVPRRMCQREGLLGSVYRAFQIFAPCFRYIRKRSDETRRAIVIQMLTNPNVFKNQILEALDDADDEIRLMILRSLLHFTPELRKRILEKVILHQSVSKSVTLTAVSMLRQCMPDEQVDIVEKIWCVDTLEKIGILEEIVEVLVRSSVPKSVDILLKDVYHSRHKTCEKLKGALIRKTSQDPQLVTERLRILIERREKILNDNCKAIICELMDVIPEKLIDNAVVLLDLLTKDASSKIRLLAYKKLSRFQSKHTNWLSIFAGGLCDSDPEVVKFVFSELKNHKMCVPEDRVCPKPTANVHVLLLLLRIASGDMTSVVGLFETVIEHENRRMWKWVQEEAVKVIAASSVDLSDRILNILLDLSDRILNILLDQRQSDDRRVLCLQIIDQMCSDDSLRRIVANNHELQRVLVQIHRRSLHLESARLAGKIIDKIGGDNHAQ